MALVESDVLRSLLRIAPESRGATNSLRFLPDDEKLDQCRRRWHGANMGSRVSTNVRHWKPVISLLLASKYLARVRMYSLDRKGLIQKWDDMGRPLVTRQLETQSTSMTLLQNDQGLGVGTRSGEVHFLDSQSLEDRLSVTEVASRYRGRVHSLLYSPSKKQFVVAGKGGVRGAIDETSQQVVAEFGSYGKAMNGRVGRERTGCTPLTTDGAVVVEYP